MGVIVTDFAALTEQVREGIRWLEATSIGDRGHALVAVLRDGHWRDEHSIGCKPCAALAALDALVEALAQAEKEARTALMFLEDAIEATGCGEDELISEETDNVWVRIISARQTLAALAAGRDGGQ